MAKSCPISRERVDQNVCRAVAALVLLVIAAGDVLGSAWVFAALAADFLVRGLGFVKYSPLRWLALGANKVLHIPVQSTDAAPKRFAARIGAVFCVTIALLMAAGMRSAATGVSAVFGGCAFLEAAFGFCVGCRLYGLLPQRVAQLLAR